MSAQPTVCDWTEVADSVSRVNRPLHDLLARAAPVIGKAKAKVVRLRYPFGAEILRNGCLLPSSLPAVPSSTSWPAIPLGLITSNTAEVFLATSDGVPSTEEPGGVTARLVSYPLTILRKGHLFGVFEAVDRHLHRQVPAAPWSMTAGARTVHLIVALRDSQLRNALADRIDGDWHSRPKWDGYSWELLCAMAAKQSEWTAEVLLFPDVWFMNQSLSPCRELVNHLFHTAWEQSANLRDDAQRVTQIGTWCAHNAWQRRQTLFKRQLDLATDWSTPYLLHLIESVSRRDGIAFALCPFVEGHCASELGPFDEAAKVFAEAALAAGVSRVPILALPTTERSRAKFIPLELPLRRGPRRPKEGWATFLYLLDGFLRQTVNGRSSPSDAGEVLGIDLKKLDFIARPPRLSEEDKKKLTRRSSSTVASARLWNDPLGTRTGKLIPAEREQVSLNCPEVGTVGKGVIDGAPFFAACIRVCEEPNAATKSQRRAQ